MLTDYIQAAMDSISWKILPDGSFYAEIPLLGIKTTCDHLEPCQCRIRELLEEYIIFSLSTHQSLPAIGNVSIEIKGISNQNIEDKYPPA